MSTQDVEALAGKVGEMSVAEKVPSVEGTRKGGPRQKATQTDAASKKVNEAFSSKKISQKTNKPDEPTQPASTTRLTRSQARALAKKEGRSSGGTTQASTTTTSSTLPPATDAQSVPPPQVGTFGDNVPTASIKFSNDRPSSYGIPHRSGQTSFRGRKAPTAPQAMHELPPITDHPSFHGIPPPYSRSSVSSVHPSNRQQLGTLPYRPPPHTKPAGGRDPILNLLKRPRPTTAYLARVDSPPQLLETPRRLLVVLDLNGTLIHRTSRGTNFKRRPKLDEFLDYLMRNHKVVVWSSAMAEKVMTISQKIFGPPAGRGHPVAVWGRDTLRLPPHISRQRVQVYKQLSWIWEDPTIQHSYPAEEQGSAGKWDQSNTVLLDDSVEKAASEPYNLIQIQEFEATPQEMTQDILGQVVAYLETVKWQVDVSAYIKQNPFKFAPDGWFDWDSATEGSSRDCPTQQKRRSGKEEKDLADLRSLLDSLKEVDQSSLVQGTDAT